jgi:hypothetical protein
MFTARHADLSRRCRCSPSSSRAACRRCSSPLAPTRPPSRTSRATLPTRPPSWRCAGRRGGGRSLSRSCAGPVAHAWQLCQVQGIPDRRDHAGQLCLPVLLPASLSMWPCPYLPAVHQHHHRQPAAGARRHQQCQRCAGAGDHPGKLHAQGGGGGGAGLHWGARPRLLGATC